MKINERSNLFQHLVLSALWIIILFLAKRDFDAKSQATSWVSDARYFGDAYGVKSAEAKEYRRNNTYKMF